jgi:hypothetical protein
MFFVAVASCGKRVMIDDGIPEKCCYGISIAFSFNFIIASES